MSPPPIPLGLYTRLQAGEVLPGCLRQYELKYVRGEVRRSYGWHRAWDGRAQGSRGVLLRGEAHRCPARPGDHHRDVPGCMDYATGGPIPLQDGDEGDEDRGVLTDRGVAMVSAFHAHAARRLTAVEAVEKSFGIP